MTGNGSLIVFTLLFVVALGLLALVRWRSGIKIGLALLLIALGYELTGRFLGETGQWIFVIVFIVVAVARKAKGHRDSEGDT